MVGQGDRQEALDNNLQGNDTGGYEKNTQKQKQIEIFWFLLISRVHNSFQKKRVLKCLPVSLHFRTR
jgi:hypothetical protein